MRKNILWLVIGGLISSLLSGCARSEGASSEIREIPGGVIYNSGNNPLSPGLEIRDKTSQTRDTTEIKLFLGGESPEYNRGRRAEKVRDRRDREYRNRQDVVDRARQDALGGVQNYQGISARWWGLYDNEFNRTNQNFQRRDQHRYDRDEYRRGQEDYREKHEQYKRTGRIIDQVRDQARQDARRGVFYPPQNRFIREYKDAHREEDERLQRNYHHRNEKRW